MFKLKIGGVGKLEFKDYKSFKKFVDDDLKLKFEGLM
jgi:hypothetical protein